MPRTDTFKFGLQTALARGLPIGSLVLASAFFSPSEFGKFAVAVAGFSVALAISDSGLDSAATLLAGRLRREDYEQLIASLFAARLILAGTVGAGLIITFVAQSGLPMGSRAVTIGCASLALIAAITTATQRVEARIGSRQEVKLLVIEKGLGSALFVGSVALQLPLDLTVVLYFVSLALGSLVALTFAPMPRMSGAKRFLRSLATSASAFAISAISANVVWRCGVLYLGFLGNHAMAGALSAAIMPVQAVGLISTFGSALLLLQREVSWRGTVAEVRRLLAVAAACACGILCLYWGLKNLPPLGTMNARETLDYLLILTLCLPFLWCNPVLGMRARVAGLSGIVSLVTAMAALIALGISTLAVHGHSWAAIAIVAAEAFVTVCLVVSAFLRRERTGGR